MNDRICDRFIIDAGLLKLAGDVGRQGKFPPFKYLIILLFLSCSLLCDEWPLGVTLDLIRRWETTTARTHKTDAHSHEAPLESLKCCWRRRRRRQKQRRLWHASFASCCLLDAAVVIPRSSASADRHSSSGRRRRRRNITSFVHFWPLSPPPLATIQLRLPPCTPPSPPLLSPSLLDNRTNPYHLPPSEISFRDRRKSESGGENKLPTCYACALWHFPVLGLRHRPVRVRQFSGLLPQYRSSSIPSRRLMKRDCARKERHCPSTYAHMDYIAIRTRSFFTHQKFLIDWFRFVCFLLLFFKALTVHWLDHRAETI